MCTLQIYCCTSVHPANLSISILFSPLKIIVIISYIIENIRLPQMFNDRIKVH